MRDQSITKEFYVKKLGFQQLGNADFEGYLMIRKDDFKFTFSSLKNLIPKKIMGKCISEPIILMRCISRFRIIR